MELFQILGKCGNSDLLTILGVIRTVIRVITFVIPIILIVMGVMDLSKVVTAGGDDDKASKTALKRFGTRVIYAVVIFLIPTIISLIFNILPSNVFGSGANGVDYTWKDCWDEAK